MNHGTKVQLLADPNGDLTISNDDGTITVHANGDISISTLAPINLVGESLGKLDYQAQVAPRVLGDANCNVSDVLRWLRTRGKKS
jgi:hypothetical protein